MSKIKYKKFGIHVKVSNFKKSYKFYKALGLKEIFIYGPKEFLRNINPSIATANEKYRGITFDIGNSLLEIAEDHIAVKKDVFEERIQSSKVSAMIHVNKLSNILSICRKCNIKIAKGPRKFPWGTRELVIKDPDGFVLVFIEKCLS